MPEKQIIVKGIEITVIRKKIKNMYLRVLPPDGRVQITAPLRVTDRQILDFAQSRLGWITSQKKRAADRRSGWPERYETGETVWLWGKPCRLEFRHQSDRSGAGEEACRGDRRSDVRRCCGDDIFGRCVGERFDTSKIDIIEEERKILLYDDRNSTEEQREKILKEWYRSQMREAVPPIFAECEALTGVRAKEWRIRDMKTRWGTCNTAKSRIWLNLRLVQMPPECLKYVIIHELTHLLEPGHNQRFYHFMDCFLPEWRAVRKAMREW